MSSKKETNWSTPIMVILVAGLAFYSMTRGPSCPANTPRSIPAANTAPSTAPSTVTQGYGTLVHANDSNFDQIVLQAKGPVLVDFYADWCGPCQKLAPELERVAADLTEGRIVKVDADRNPKLVAQYNVAALPTLLVFVDGQVVDRAMGFHDEQELRSLLQR